jgi:23S rRNA G2445 N2-methylase RlmL
MNRPTSRRTGAAELPACYAITFPGLEEVATEELTDELGADVKRTSPGLVVFRIEEIAGNLLDLKTVEDVFLLGWGTNKLTFRATDLEEIRRFTAREADWDRLLQIHHKIRPKPRGKPTFRLVTQMTGHHGYRRADARKALVQGLAGKLPASWRHVEENAAIEIWLTIHDATAVCGVRLSDRTMRHRTYKLEHQPASLRPTIAAAMVRLAALGPHQVIADPMCGAGTILAEVLEWTRIHGVRIKLVVAGDCEPSALRSAGANLRRLGPASLIRWDATRVPLAGGCVDRIICNPPFGKQLSRPDEIHALYRRLMLQWDRILGPKGRAVVLVSDLGALKDEAAKVNWKKVRQTRIRVLGQPAYITVWDKRRG